jgi:hypothetical protein
MDAFDLFWQWADKPLDSLLTIFAELYRAVMDLAPEDRRDRAKVNEAVRERTISGKPHGHGPLRPGTGAFLMY